MSILCADIAMVSAYAWLENDVYRLAKRLWPGPYTLILKPGPELPKYILGKRKTIGVRVPDQELCQLLVAELGRPILSTSINSSFLPEDHSPMAINEHPRLRKYIEYVIDLGVDPPGPSTVIDLTGAEPKLLREGLGPVDFL